MELNVRNANKIFRCSELRGRCSEYRNIEDIRAEIEAVMQSAKIAGDKDSKDRGIQGDGQIETSRT